ncbi:MAG: hypothetical protein EBT03_07665 [Betaproteobacteria bacterium]|nr:hypothetical protein [Betaproteobacteria bacterium]NCA16961.1 hypothetical protein [Betaproteobacteria bacterium]
MDRRGDDIRKLIPNKPVRDVQGGKEFVVRARVGDKERIVRFGDPTMDHYKEGDSDRGHGDEGRRANFKSRHNCADKKDKLTPGWWSCNWSW